MQHYFNYGMLYYQVEGQNKSNEQQTNRIYSWKTIKYQLSMNFLLFLDIISIFSNSIYTILILLMLLLAKEPRKQQINLMCIQHF